MAGVLLMILMETSTQDCIDRDASNGRRFARQNVTIYFAWSAAIALLLIAVLRVVAYDASYVLICLNSFTLYLYLPAYFILAFAIWKRRLWLAVVSLVVVGCHIGWNAPDYRPAAPSAGKSVGARRDTLRVFFFNTYRYNKEFQAVFDEIDKVDPDVIVLAEFFHTWKDALLQSPLVKRYPYGTNIKAWESGDVVVLSRLPVDRLESTWAARRAYIDFSVPLGDQVLHFFCLHSPRPMTFEWNDYDGFWKEALPAILSQPRPLVVLGDFNSTQHSLIYRKITAAGLRSTHADRGRGYATTWPNGSLPLPPIRIDHAFVSPEVECVRCEEGIGAGSDHRPLILELQLRPGEVDPKNGAP